MKAALNITKTMGASFEIISPTAYFVRLGTHEWFLNGRELTHGRLTYEMELAAANRTTFQRIRSWATTGALVAIGVSGVNFLTDVMV